MAVPMWAISAPTLGPEIAFDTTAQRRSPDPSRVGGREPWRVLDIVRERLGPVGR